MSQGRSLKNVFEARKAKRGTVYKVREREEFDHEVCSFISNLVYYYLLKCGRQVNIEFRLQKILKK
ncbi:hypothetical protein D0T60_18345 [Bacteroides sp. 224]|nr:hypothetical protein [Bacteroides sp. 224]